MCEIFSGRLIRRCRRGAAIALALGFCAVGVSTDAQTTDQVYFSSTTNVTNILVQYINRETVRLDISSWYLSEHSISIAIANRWAAGVPVRVIGDRAALFENDPHTKNEFYWLASQGVPIRLRYNPTWFPEIDHWKTAIFVGQNAVEFGSGNFAPTELAPVSSTNYDDDSEMFTTDPVLVNAFKTKFDQKWNDTTVEPNSIIAAPPYLKDWDDACANEPTGGCADYHTLYPNPVPMVVNTARLEPDNPLPADFYWGQGSAFNNRLTQEITNETSMVDLVVYRLEVDNITQALLSRFQAGVNVRVVVDPAQYTNNAWPEYWLTHANVDKLYAAGVPMLTRVHQGVTHMKTLITSNYATNASSNFAANWQRDQDYFVSAATKPDIYRAFVNDFQSMWSDTTNFAPFTPTPPFAADLVTPASGAGGVATNVTLTWSTAPYATSYDVYLGTTSANMVLVANVPAQLVQNPPTEYSWTPPTPLQPGTNYDWKVVSRTFATPVNPSMIATSTIQAFTTAGSAGPPAAPTIPSPSDGAFGVSTTPTLGWGAGALGTTYTVALGTTSPPAQVVTGLTTPSFAAGTLAPNTTYYWKVTAVSNGFSTAGSIWSFVTGTGSGGGAASDAVIYASDVAPSDIHGAWSQVSDSTAAAGVKLSNPDAGAATVAGPLAAPADYFDASFQAVGNTRYRVWLRMHAIANSKFNDSVFVQFSDTVDANANPIYRMGTTGGLLVNLATDAGATSLQGWGWQRNAYWLADTGDVWFQNSGEHTIRVQVREDGVEVNQIVISPTTYVNNAPGPVSNDNTIVPKPAIPPSAPGLPEPANGATGVDPNVTLTWSASGATSYDVNFGTTNPPPLAAAGMPGAFYAPGALNNTTTYFWQVVAHNANGTTSGAVWSFSTAGAQPPPPAAPGSPSPASGASGIGTTPALTWTASGATSYDVFFGATNPPPQVTTAQAAASYTPAALSAGVPYFWQIVARNASGTTAGPIWTFTTGSGVAAADIVIYASDVPSTGLHGTWATAADPSSPGGVKLATPDNGAATIDPPLAAPANYVDVPFNAPAGTPFTIWMRVQALNNSKFNDSLFVQFSDASAGGSPAYPIGSTTGLDVNLATDASGSSNAGWGWVNSAYWLTQPVTVTFANNGAHTLRVQIREDGVQFDQIVLSASTYLNAAPGARSNDSTIVAKPQPPAAPGTPSPANAASGVSAAITLGWSAAGATSYDVSFGTTSTPPLVASGISSPSFTPGTLSATTTYFWQVVAHNAAGTASGPLWSFTTSAAPPPPPSAPATPSPANGTTNAPLSPTLTWSAPGATSYDVNFGTTNPPPQVSAAQTATSIAPGALTNGTTYFWQVVAHNGAGTTSGPIWSFSTAAAPTSSNIVIYASDIPAANLHGVWSTAADATAAGGVKLVTPDNGTSSTNNPLAAPTDFVDVTFNASAGVPYTLWLRMEALANSKFNDSLWVQFSDATVNGSSIYPLNTTSGLDVNLATDATGSSLNQWGWQNTGYWLSQPTTFTFASGGTHTMRIQVREDGVEFDQIVLSPVQYATAAPGGPTNDTTIVSKP